MAGVINDYIEDTGDMLSNCLVLDKITRDKMELLEPHYDIHSTANPGHIKANITLPQNTVGAYANWMFTEEWAI